ncbi:hypothetical protein [Actinoallomurus iriomotensis]|uniref:Uncharacterized protein n=1 Tax=Actinoallomurus iriomotensis TaxID=478107 RepID=A0A9W6SDP2_9ACTN|nr:hypothetical protein [Actinoallomurus iriomotensis]GLY90342.1 hypothetical protein Airi02_082710 [Actinoallomurus iriomotensis]
MRWEDDARRRHRAGPAASDPHHGRRTNGAIPGAPPHVVPEILGHAGIMIAKRDFSIDDWIITAKGK